MRMIVRDCATGWLSTARPCPSPNQDARPADGGPIDLLVIHCISLPHGQFGGPEIEQLFLNQLNPAEHPSFHALAGLRVSSHVLIRRDGEQVQFVNLHARAWHAGVSSFEGRTHCNDFSIGIELEGTDAQPFTAAQYDSLIDATRHIQQLCPAITTARIVGHQHIAPGRKTDPGIGFDWEGYLKRL